MVEGVGWLVRRDVSGDLAIFQRRLRLGDDLWTDVGQAARNRTTDHRTLHLGRFPAHVRSPCVEVSQHETYSLFHFRRTLGTWGTCLHSHLRRRAMREIPQEWLAVS